MSILVSALFILLYLFVAGALFRGMLQDYPYDTFGEKLSYLLCSLIWPLYLIPAGVIIIQAEIKRWRDRRD